MTMAMSRRDELGSLERRLAEELKAEQRRAKLRALVIPRLVIVRPDDPIDWTIALNGLTLIDFEEGSSDEQAG